MLRFFLTSLLILTACSSSSKKTAAKTPDVPVPSLEPIAFKTGPFVDRKTLSVKPLTSSGENAEAYFSPDAKKVLYHSQKRPEHVQTQIYELNLTNMRERRLTFHDGDDADATYTSDSNYILYSSTTDEIKEEREAISSVMKTYAPNLVKNKKTNDFKPYEIYLSKTDGSQIYRVTNSAGYDAEASINPQGTKIVFVSTRGGPANIYMIPFHLSDWTKKWPVTSARRPSREIASAASGAASAKVWRLSNDDSYDANPIFVPQTDQLVWVKYSKDLKTSQIMIGDSVGKNARVLISQKGLNITPFLNSATKEIAFSSNRDGSGHFNIYTIDLAGLCIKKLTDQASDQINPSFSPDGKQMLFTSNLSAKNQIYLADYISPNACLDEIP